MGQKIAIAPRKPPAAATSGSAATSISWRSPSSERTWNRLWDGRPSRSAMTSGSASAGIGAPASSRGPNMALHSSNGSLPISSKRFPNSEPAASLKNTSPLSLSTRNPGVEMLESRLRARMSSSGFCSSFTFGQRYRASSGDRTRPFSYSVAFAMSASQVHSARHSWSPQAVLRGRWLTLLSFAIFVVGTVVLILVNGLFLSRDLLFAWVLLGLLALPVSDLKRWVRGLIFDWLPFAAWLVPYYLTPLF